MGSEADAPKIVGISSPGGGLVAAVCDFLPLTAPGVEGLMPYQPGKPMDELQRQYGLSDIVKLASNENPLGPGTAALEVFSKTGQTLSPALSPALSQVMSRYPDGNGFALKLALAQHLEVEQECITLGNGSNEILELVARTFLTPAHEAVFSAHAFAVYPIVTQAVGAKAVVVPAKAWGHDLAAMQASLSERTRVIFIANPNNPTGTWLAASALRAFLAAIPTTAIVVLDEAYFEYVEAADYPNGMQWLAEFPNLIVTRTFSKIHGLAGLRIGYAASHPQVAELLNRVRQPFNVNSAAQSAALAALTDTEHVLRSRQVNRAGMQQLTSALTQLGIETIPSVGNFLCLRVDDANAIYESLLRLGVIVRPIANYGMPDYLRVTVGTEAENTRFLDALKGS